MIKLQQVDGWVQLTPLSIPTHHFATLLITLNGVRTSTVCSLHVSRDRVVLFRNDQCVQTTNSSSSNNNDNDNIRR